MLRLRQTTSCVYDVDVAGMNKRINTSFHKVLLRTIAWWSPAAGAASSTRPSSAPSLIKARGR